MGYLPRSLPRQRCQQGSDPDMFGGYGNSGEHYPWINDGRVRLASIKDNIP
jgi:hypothetical protein